jgi:membrane-associated phospholipid phosphatase
MTPGGLPARLAALDACATAATNGASRRNPAARRIVAVLAERLAAVEVGLMGLLLVGGRPRSVARMLLAVGLVYGASEALGRLWPRDRPFERCEAIEALVEHTSGRSFPSRHVASGLAMAAIGQRAHPGVGRLMTLVAALLGTMRVAAGLHYPSDVVGGAILGIVVGRSLR